MAGKEIRERFFTLENTEVDASANSRRESWAAAWQIAKDNPIFGVGIRNSNLLSHEYGADMEGRTIHSQYLQTAADSGLVALALYLTALGLFWFSTRRTRTMTTQRTDLDGRQAYAAACGVEGAMIVFCVGAAFLSLENFELPYLMLLIGAQLPLVLATAPAAVPTAAEGRPGPTPGRMLRPLAKPAESQKLRSRRGSQRQGIRVTLASIFPSCAGGVCVQKAAGGRESGNAPADRAGIGLGYAQRATSRTDRRTTASI